MPIQLNMLSFDRSNRFEILLLHLSYLIRAIAYLDQVTFCPPLLICFKAIGYCDCGVVGKSNNMWNHRKQNLHHQNGIGMELFCLESCKIRTRTCRFQASMFFRCALVKWSDTFLWLAALKTFLIWLTGDDGRRAEMIERVLFITVFSNAQISRKGFDDGPFPVEHANGSE